MLKSHLALSPKIKAIIQILAGTLFFSFIGILFIPLPDPLFSDDYSTVILDRNDEIMRAFLNGREQWHFPPDKNRPIPEKLEKAVILFEDRYFNYHLGINPLSVGRAIWQNLEEDRVISGASTITMQVARLMKPKPRTIFNKLLEMLQSFKLELLYSKEEILRLYLDHAPYGGNVVGSQAASLRYFRKVSEQLSWAEAAVLAVLPNAPGLISPTGDFQALQKKRNRLLLKLYQANIIDRETWQLAQLEKVPERSYPITWAAPHLSRALKLQSAGGVIRTTIDRRIQWMAGKTVSRHVDDLRLLGVGNGAAIIVETQSGEVSAYVGSANYFDAEFEGQVDGVIAPRSSGSIFKPFLYALGMDNGLILPQTLLRDVPTFYGAFSPSNSDQKFRGVVTAEQALVQSLNIPAVRLLNAYGLHSFYHFLSLAGLKTLFRGPDDYGLPLIIGGAETTLWDMAGLYRGLSQGGIFEEVYVLKDQPAGSAPKELISPGSAYLTLEMMNEVKRPGAEYYWQLYQNQWPMAWKTGTSYGQKDGWAIGVSPQWTIAVWVGNFNGKGNNNLSGAACAGPLLFELFNALPKDADLVWFEKPLQHLEEITICSQTGFQAGPLCPDRQIVLAPFDQRPLKVCPWHRQIIVNEDENEQVCSLCWEENHKSIVRLIYPPDISQYLRLNGQPVEQLPPHRKKCPALAQGKPLQIIYPQKKATLWVPRDFGGVLQKVACRVAHQQKNQTIYWYLDTHFQGSTREKHVKALSLDKGWHQLEVIDEAGNRAQVKFYADRK